MDALTSLVKLSSVVAIAPELTQGGGGNTSVKEGDTMLIKASGFRLDEVSEQGGFVKVQYQPVVDFLKKDTNTLQQPDAELKQFVNEQIIGDKTFLPSMETGFHAVLGDYVIHTHPVAVNQLLCAHDGEKTLAKLFKSGEYIVLPFLNPGYYLSKAVAELNAPPAIIFLTNHGLIVHGKDENETIKLHNAVIQKITSYLESEDDFHFELKEINEELFELKADWLKTFIRQPGLLSSTYFPDQAVVIGQDYQFKDSNSNEMKINFIPSPRQCFLKTGRKNALAIAENLCALANIILYISEDGNGLTALPDADVAYILGMDMEKYRQGLLK